MMTRLVADLCFTNMNGALDAVAELEQGGFTTIVSHEVIDIFSGSVFVEAFVDIEFASDADVWAGTSEMLTAIDAFVKPFGGFCDGVLPVSPSDHVPFKEYREHGG
jgi:hypothetical protein